MKITWYNNFLASLDGYLQRYCAAEYLFAGARGSVPAGRGVHRRLFRSRPRVEPRRSSLAGRRRSDNDRHGHRHDDGILNHVFLLVT